MKRLVAIAFAFMLSAFAPQPPDTVDPAPDRKAGTSAMLTDIRIHLINKRCWADHSDLPDARTLRATFRIWFGRDGRFSREPELVFPQSEPEAGTIRAGFVADARRALTLCNEIGWPVPALYFELSDPPPWIEIEFLPKVPAPAS